MAGERSDLGKIFITDGGIYDANTTYEKLTMVSYNNSTYITLRTVTGVTPSNDRINYGLMAQGFTATYLSSVTAEDVQGLVVEAGSETPAQSLINAIADRVANQLVSNSDLQDILGDYILKSAIANNLSITEEGKVLDARQGKALNDALAPLLTVSSASLPPSNGWTGSATGYKIGKLVFVYGNCYNATEKSMTGIHAFIGASTMNAASMPLGAIINSSFITYGGASAGIIASDGYNLCFNPRTANIPANTYVYFSVVYTTS